MESRSTAAAMSGLNEETRVVYSIKPFVMVKLPKYDKIGEKRGDELVKISLAGPVKSKEVTYIRRSIPSLLRSPN